jgi:hypothetical protein
MATRAACRQLLANVVGQPIGPRNRGRRAVPSGSTIRGLGIHCVQRSRWISITGTHSCLAGQCGQGGRRYSRKLADATAVQAIGVIAQASLLSRQVEVDASARKRGRCGEDTCMQPIRSRSEERTLTPTPSTAPRRHLRLNPVCTRLAGAARPNLFGAVRPSTMPAFVVASAKRMNFNLAQNTLGCVFTHTAKHTKCDFKSGM